MNSGQTKLGIVAKGCVLSSNFEMVFVINHVICGMKETNTWYSPNITESVQFQDFYEFHNSEIFFFLKSFHLYHLLVNIQIKDRALG